MGFRRFFRRRYWDGERGREIDAYLEFETAENIARGMTGGKNPIGRRLRIQANPGQPEPWYEIVGLVRDTKYGTLRDPFGPIVYVAESQSTETIARPKFLVRSDLGLAAVTPAVRRVIHNIDPTVTVSYSAFRKDVRQVLLPERLMAMIAASFGLLAAVLAMTGLYGVVA